MDNYIKLQRQCIRIRSKNVRMGLYRPINTIFRMVRRPRTYFLIFGACGFIGEYIDFDHLICIWMGLGTFNPQAGEFGCRLYHHLLIPIIGICIGISCTLLFGLCVSAIKLAFRPTN